MNSLEHRLTTTPEAEAKQRQLRALLAEVHELLEEYAPAWYTPEQHDKIDSALRAGEKVVKNGLQTQEAGGRPLAP